MYISPLVNASVRAILPGSPVGPLAAAAVAVTVIALNIRVPIVKLWLKAVRLDQSAAFTLPPKLGIGRAWQ